VVLPPDVRAEQVVERRDRPPPGNVIAHLEPLGVLVEHRFTLQFILKFFLISSINVMLLKKGSILVRIIKKEISHEKSNH
jgi:hypothetical protein